MKQLKAGSQYPPLFLVHGFGGSLARLSSLLRYLSPDESVYELEAQNPDSREPILNRVDEIARRYIVQIQTIQPEGPYFLTGYSFGGLVAYEIAQQLQISGQTVAFLGLFDTRRPGQGGQQKSLVSFGMARRYLVRSWQLLTDPELKGVLKSRITGKIWQLFYFQLPTGKLLRRFRKGLDQATSTATKIQAANIEAIATYVCRPYPGRLTLFRARERSPIDRVDWYLGWKEFALGGVDVFELPGNHVTMGDEPNVAGTGAIVSAALRDARNRHKSPEIRTSTPHTGPAGHPTL